MMQRYRRTALFASFGYKLLLKEGGRNQKNRRAEVSFESKTWWYPQPLEQGKKGLFSVAQVRQGTTERQERSRLGFWHQRKKLLEILLKLFLPQTYCLFLTAITQQVLLLGSQHSLFYLFSCFILRQMREGQSQEQKVKESKHGCH